MRNDGAAHKSMEAPRSINRAMHEDGISVTSHQPPVKKSTCLRRCSHVLFQFCKETAGDDRQKEIDDGCRDERLPHAVVLCIRCIRPVHKLRRRDDGGERRVFDQAHEGIAQCGDDRLQRLRQDDISHALPCGKPQRTGGLPLPYIDGLDARTDRFRNVCPRIDGKRECGREDSVRLLHEKRHDAEVGDQQLQEERRPAYAFDEEQRWNGQPFLF